MYKVYKTARCNWIEEKFVPIERVLFLHDWAWAMYIYFISLINFNQFNSYGSSILKGSN